MPLVVAQSLARFLPAASATAQGTSAPEGDPLQLRIRVRDMEVSSGGPSALVARGEGELCRDANCAVGVFERSGADFRPVLLAMSSGEPELYPIGAQGRPALVLNHIDGPHLLRSVRYRWDGAEYKADACTQFDRLTNAASRCDRADARDTPVYRGPLQALCKSLAGAARAAPGSTLNAPPHPDGFLLRRSEWVHVQALRLPPLRDASGSVRPEALVACLRRAGFRLQAQDKDGAALQRRWLSAANSRPADTRLALTWSELPERPYALLTFGIFRVRLGETVSYFTAPDRSTYSWK